MNGTTNQAPRPLPTQTARLVRRALVRFLIPWSAMVAACLVLAGLGTRLPAAAAPPAISGVLVAAAAACALLILALERTLVGPAAIAARVPPNDVDLALRHLLAGHLLLWSLVGLLPLLGLAQLLLGGRPSSHLLMCGVAVAILARLMPTRARIAARIAPVLR